MNAGLLWHAIRAYRQGRKADSGAYKAAAFGGRAYAHVEERLHALAEPLPAISRDTLRRCRAGSFGRAYADFMDARGLRPLEVSPEVAAELGAGHLLDVRYVLLHDTFHVLLGFDTDLPGELGVWSFVSAQCYSPTYERAAGLGRLLYPVIAPGQLAHLRACDRRGRRLAGQAVSLIVQPIERYWNMPLDEVRAAFGLHEAQSAVA